MKRRFNEYLYFTTGSCKNYKIIWEQPEVIYSTFIALFSQKKIKSPYENKLWQLSHFWILQKEIKTILIWCFTIGIPHNVYVNITTTTTTTFPQTPYTTCVALRLRVVDSGLWQVVWDAVEIRDTDLISPFARRFGRIELELAVTIHTLL